MGKNIVMVETVGTGQSEVGIMSVADTTVVILSADSGDDIQLMKAGVMEIADIFVVNKVDKGGAEKIQRGIELMLEMKNLPVDEWKPPIVLAEALSGKGVKILADEIIRHQKYLADNNGLYKKRGIRARLELEAMMENTLKNYVHQEVNSGKFEGVLTDLAERKITPYTAMRMILEAFARKIS
jgi:LAO/AO transport system kinase